jgi:mannose-6-phosphate isomerase
LGIAPFLLEPIIKPKPWGGRSLERLFGRSLPEGGAIGESWEVSARPGESNLIASGPHAGTTLLELIETEPEAVLGAGVAAAHGNRLPVIAKFIDAARWLSIQVHPDDCVAKALQESDPGKEEAWLVVDARPGATLVLGVSHEMSFEKLIELCEEKKYEECLNFVEVQAGDVISIPPGTLHSAGEGIVLFEVSANSDLTYRVDDWNRRNPKRELHRDKAREILTCSPPVLPRRPRASAPVSVLHEAQHFRMAEVFPGKSAISLDADSFAALTALEGSLVIESGDNRLDVPAGRTVFLPSPASSAGISGPGRGVAVLPGTGPKHKSP